MSETYTTDSAEALAEALAEHRLTTPVQCSCGWRETDSRQSCPRCGGKAFSRVGCPACDSSGSVRETHEAHVAQALITSGAVRPAAEVRAEALRESADFIADTAGIGESANDFGSGWYGALDYAVGTLRDRAALAEEGDR